MAEIDASQLSPPITPGPEESHTPPPLPGHPPAMTRIVTTGNAPTIASSKPFDIVATYKDLLLKDSELTMPIAAIEALIALLTHNSSSTISETLDLLRTSTEQLKRSVPNAIGLSAGTDLFQRYIVSQMQRPGQLGPAGDFKAIRAHLLANSRIFITRAKRSREDIARFGRGLVRDGCTVLTNGGSRVVGALLEKAASDEKSAGPAMRFRVMYVLSERAEAGQDAEGLATVKALRGKGVPVATIPESAVAYAMGKVDMVFVGAEGVVENGGIISRMGTYQIGILAHSMGKPFYVVAESHKFVRLYPLGQYDLPVKQEVLDFRTDNDKEGSRPGPNERKWEDKTPVVKEKEEYFDEKTLSPTDEAQIRSSADAVDFTPPHLISALITEDGVMTPGAVSEELIKMWF